MTAQKSPIDAFLPYLTYAKNLQAAEPIIALCCKTFYISKVVDYKKKSGTQYTPEETAQMGKLFKESEEEKKTLGLTKEMGQEAVEDFCTRQFVAANLEEKNAPKITRGHALQFKNTANFIDLLGVYGELPPDWEQKSTIKSLMIREIL